MINDVTNIVIAYHKNCIDGFTAAWVADKRVRVEGYTPVLLAMEYKPESTLELMELLGTLPAKEKSELFVVDFSLPVDVLANIAEGFPNVQTVILDHHKTAFEAYMPEGYVVKPDSRENIKVHGAKVFLENAYSGAAIAYMYFYGLDFSGEQASPMLKIIAYIQDYDLWKYEFGDDTKYVNKVLMQEEKTLANWERIGKSMETPEGLAAILMLGEELQEKHDAEVASYAKYYLNVTIAGIEGLVTTCPPKYTSDVGHALTIRSETFGACIAPRELNDTSPVTWSLRSTGDFDVSILAKAMGGGGHKNAAGFTISKKESEELLGYEC